MPNDPTLDAARKNDVQPSILKFVSLLEAANKGIPLAKSALPAAKQAAEAQGFFGPPPVEDDESRMSKPAPLNMSVNRPLTLNPPPSPVSDGLREQAGPPTSQISISGPSPSASVPSSGTQDSGARVHETNIPTEEKRPSFWQSDAFRDRLQIGGSALLGAGIGKLTGLGGTLVGGYAGAEGVEDFKKKQQEALARRHKLFEDVYGQVQSLPVEVYNTPGMESLTQAAEAVRKSMAAGKVDDEKTLSAFLTEKAKYGKELEDLQLQSKIAEKQKIDDAIFQQDIARKQQRGAFLREAIKDPQLSPPMREQMQAELFQIDKEQQEFRAKQEMIKQEQLHRQEMERQGRVGLGLQQQGLNMRHELGMAGLQSREKVAQMGSVNRAISQEVERARKVAMETMQPFDEDQAQKDAMKRALGITQMSPGNIMVMGERVPLNSILGNDPAMWDAGGTPSQAGWDRVFAQLHSQLGMSEAQLNSPQAMGMTNIQY